MDYTENKSLITSNNIPHTCLNTYPLFNYHIDKLDYILSTNELAFLHNIENHIHYILSANKNYKSIKQDEFTFEIDVKFSKKLAHILSVNHISYSMQPSNKCRRSLCCVCYNSNCKIFIYSENIINTCYAENYKCQIAHHSSPITIKKVKNIYLATATY